MGLEELGKSKIVVYGEYSCPHCKSTNRVFAKAHEETERRGLHPHAEVYMSRRTVEPLIPIQRAVFTIPVIVKYHDNCLDCGAEYIFRIDFQDAPVTSKDLPKGK